MHLLYNTEISIFILSKWYEKAHKDMHSDVQSTFIHTI